MYSPVMNCWKWLIMFTFLSASEIVTFSAEFCDLERNQIPKERWRAQQYLAIVENDRTDEPPSASGQFTAVHQILKLTDLHCAFKARKTKKNKKLWLIYFVNYSPCIHIHDLKFYFGQ